MTRAQFTVRQPETKFTETDGMTYVQICLHEEPVEVTDPDTGTTTTEYLYDFNEWHEKNPDRAAIEADPEAYLDYQPAPEPKPEPPVPSDIRDQVEINAANIEYIAMMTDVELN